MSVQRPFFRCLALSLVAAGCCFRSFAVTGYWTGAGTDGNWTNPDNWKDGVIPGRYTSGDETLGAFGDTAVFGAVAAGARTTVVLGNGFLTVGTVRITGADAPVYTFGNAESNAQSLKLEAGGGLTVDADVVNMPVFAAYLYNATAVDGVSPTKITFANDSAATLDLPRFIEASAWTSIEFRGSGDIRLNGEFFSNSETLILNQTGRLIVNTEFNDREYGYYAPKNIKSGPDTPLARLVINKGCLLRLRTHYGAYFECTDADVEISGEGEFIANAYNEANSQGNGLRFKVPEGRTLTIAAPFRTAYNGYDDSDCRFFCATGGGTIRFLGPNKMAGPVYINNVVSIKVPVIDAPDQVSRLGSGHIVLCGWGKLKYTGSGEKTTREIRLSYPSPAAGQLIHEGTGPWDVANITFPFETGDGTLVLNGSRDDASVSSVLADSPSGKKLSLWKDGAGVWTLSATNTYTGETKVNAGVLRIAGTGSIAASSVVTLGGGSLAFAGDGVSPSVQTLKSLAVTANASLSLSGGVTVTAAVVSVSSGMILDIRTTDPSTAFVVPAGTSADRITWNGQPVRIAADGVVLPDADAFIAARGDTVPHGVGDVAIYYDGTSGDNAVTADVTTVGKLMQFSLVPSTVAIGSGRTLSLSSAVVTRSAGSLTLGAADDAGTLDSPEKRITYANAGDGALITVRAAIAPDVTNAVDEGTVVAAADTPLAYTSIARAAGARARLEIRGAAVDTGAEPVIVGNNEAGNDYNGGGMQWGELTVSNAVIRNTSDLARTERSYSTTSDHAVLVGRNASGILRVQEGAIISNRLVIGGGKDSTSGRGSGAVYQSGGHVATLGGAGYNGNCLANGSCMGYYELAGGTFSGRMALGTYGYGIWHQVAGTTADVSHVQVSVGNKGVSEVYVAGVMKAPDRGGIFCGGYQSGNIGVTTVDGPDAVLDCGNSYLRAFESDSSGVSTARVNVVRGGTLKAGLLYRNAKSGLGSRLTLSFDDGTFVCGYSGEREIFAYPADNPEKYLDEIVIYKGGMTVETSAGQDLCGTAKPLRNPDGKGVVGIPFDFSSFETWNCPPAIKIDGDGEGATAHALFDSSCQCVTGVVVTCAGWGYTWACATAAYKGNSCPENTTVDCVLADNDRTGGFTKAGAGVFTLNAVNAYAGPTTCRGGTLKTGVDHAIDASSGVVLAGGDIDFNGTAGVVSRLVYAAGGGSVLNAENMTLPASFEMALSADEMFAGKAVPFAGDRDLTGATLTVTGDLSALDPQVRRRYTLVTVSDGALAGVPAFVSAALPKGWRFVVTPACVKLVYASNLCLIVR